MVRRFAWIEQRKSVLRFGHGSPAGLSSAKSADLANVSATQHRPKQLPQSALSLLRGSVLPLGSVLLGNRLAGPAPADAGLDEVVDLTVEDT
ncbi:hypothetical protein GCM10010522_34910 [Kribbella solani]